MDMMDEDETEMEQNMKDDESESVGGSVEQPESAEKMYKHDDPEEALDPIVFQDSIVTTHETQWLWRGDSPEQATEGNVARPDWSRSATNVLGTLALDFIALAEDQATKRGASVVTRDDAWGALEDLSRMMYHADDDTNWEEDLSEGNCCDPEGSYDEILYYERAMFHKVCKSFTGTLQFTIHPVQEEGYIEHNDEEDEPPAI